MRLFYGSTKLRQVIAVLSDEQQRRDEMGVVDFNTQLLAG